MNAKRIAPYLLLGWLLSMGACTSNAGKDAQSSDDKADNGKNDNGKNGNGVCGFTTPVDLGAPDDDGLVNVPPNHPDIIYYGRVDCSDASAPAFAHPGISIRMRFTGTSLDMRLQDFGAGRSPDTNNYYAVIIDGEAPEKHEVLPTQELYELARDLPEGTHTAEIFKIGESGPSGSPNRGKGAFLGFRIDDGAQVLPLEARGRRIEFIGDSITCGYGNEVSVSYADISENPADYTYTTRNSNAWLAWGAVAARALDAEYMAVAYSGLGMARNFNGASLATLPERYLRTLPDEADGPTWDPQRAVPEVVVINLGTNDFSAGLTLDTIEAAQAQFRDTYVQFLADLRDHYPAATFIAAVGPGLSDYYPEGLTIWTRIQDDLAQIIAQRHDDGDDRVHSLVIPPQTEPYGEDYHPTAATHAAMADRLLDKLDELGLL
ncbi:MAG: SGNH/GDSL hydrolase family protein [Myxococcales bacterium]|jgi:lysophospholipase L1-like esterase|nr:SGNH/GDSL hydrolase family protein [Myxococcales bacterium]